MTTPSTQPVILFDGVCNLCNSSVQFLIRHDRKNIFLFASLQSAYGQRILEKFHLPTQEHESIILVEGDSYYSESGAALRVLRHLGGVWALLYALIIVPPFVRNTLYRFIARNRYRWFGQREQCMIPTPQLRARFLD